MTRKLNFIPEYETYDDVKKDMDEDFNYRFETRLRETKFGRPLYERINVQMVITQACPYSCSFCIERELPQGAKHNFKKQLDSLKEVLREHPNARITITGGEPSLYPKQVKKIIDIAKDTATFININSTGYRESIKEFGVPINISDNKEVSADLSKWTEATLQTIFSNVDMTLENIKKYMDTHKDHKNFSFRYLTNVAISEYNINILKEIKIDDEIEVKTFRTGDFFLYFIGKYKDKHFRITLGDMKLQQDREYKGTYSNIEIIPEGDIITNWGNEK